MPDFVRDGESEEYRRVRAGLCRQPMHAIDVNGRELPFAGGCIHERVSELKPATRGGRPGQADQSNRQFRPDNRRFARPRTALPAEARARRRGLRRIVSAVQPHHVDTGGGQDPGRRTQSNRLIRRRHRPGVVHAHRDARPRSLEFTSNIRSVI